MNGEFQILKLDTKVHRREEFDCGEESLNGFLLHSAGQNSRNDISQTYVAIEPGNDRVWGYYSLTSSSISYDIHPEPKGLPKTYRVSAILLARLAVDIQLQRQRTLGPALLMDSFCKALAVAAISGTAVFEVDALTERAKAFYLRYNFTQLLDDPYHLYYSTRDIRKLRLDC